MDTMLTYNTNSKTGPVCGGRADLGRPTKTPVENKVSFMKFLEN